MRLDSLDALYVRELKLIHSAENQTAAVLPRAHTAAHAQELKTVLRRLTAEAEAHATRISRIFKSREENSGGIDCGAVRGMVEDADHLLGETHPDVLDMGLAAATLRLISYKASVYRTLAAWAGVLEDAQGTALLNESQKDETEAAVLLEDLIKRFAGTHPED